MKKRKFKKQKYALSRRSFLKLVGLSLVSHFVLLNAGIKDALACVSRETYKRIHGDCVGGPEGLNVNSESDECKYVEGKWTDSCNIDPNKPFNADHCGQTPIGGKGEPKVPDSCPGGGVGGRKP